MSYVASFFPWFPHENLATFHAFTPDDPHLSALFSHLFPCLIHLFHPFPRCFPNFSPTLFREDMFFPIFSQFFPMFPIFSKFSSNFSTFSHQKSSFFWLFFEALLRGAAWLGGPQRCGCAGPAAAGGKRGQRGRGRGGTTATWWRFVWRCGTMIMSTPD